MHAAKEKVKDAASTAKEKLREGTAEAHEKTGKATATNKQEKELAKETSKAEKAHAKADLHQEKAEHQADYAAHHAGGHHVPLTGPHHHHPGETPLGTADPIYPASGLNPNSKNLL
ncbi:late embryogenesis abundant protein 18-like, partial [Phalaenopsis equestris]|uniref:late embryogenesis abundant protein 18-like n=1 Tax=Phalaenopsis equestris TaxID=78828 RepID=UPI0009E51B81